MNRAIRDGIDWIGYVDWTIRDFHSYNTDRGTTYNAYLVRDEKTALIDTVKEPHADELLRNVAELVHPSEVDYVVCNHAEPDHAGALPAVLAAMPNAVLVCNSQCKKALGEHFEVADWPFHLVDSGDRISLGARHLQFMRTPMVHWPESMVTYIPEERLLFSMDAFGQHLASSERFDDQVPLCTVMEEAKAYYANIVQPFGRQVTKVIEAVAALDIDLIVPAHGVIWREHPALILDAYRHWSAGRMKQKVVVLYDSMWMSTAAMADAVFDGVCSSGVAAEIMHVRGNNLTRIATEVMDAGAVAFGSATLNGEMMPMAAAVLCYLRGLKPAARAGFAFGSYGWGKGGAEAAEQGLKDLGWALAAPTVRSRYRPSEAELDACRAAGVALADSVLELGLNSSAAARLCVDP